MEYYKLINRALEDKYGKDLQGRPYYRIVQNNNNLVEKRHGAVEHYAGLIYVGTVEGIHELPKYSYIPEGYWILENLKQVDNGELLTNISYEPLWFFNEDGKYQAPNLKACIFLVEAHKRGPLPVMTEEEQKAKQRIKDMELISQGSAAGCVSDRISWGEGTSYAGLDAKVLLNGGDQAVPVTKEVQNG